MSIDVPAHIWRFLGSRISFVVCKANRSDQMGVEQESASPSRQWEPVASPAQQARQSQQQVAAPSQLQQQQQQQQAVEPESVGEEAPLCGENQLNVVMVGIECAPWSKTGTVQ